MTEDFVSTELGERGADALRELFNVGAGNAATSLSQMLGKERVHVDVPVIQYVETSRLGEVLGGEQVYCAVGFTISGGFDAFLLVLFEEGSARRLAAALLGKPVPPDDERTPLDAAARSALDETGNIVASSFVSGLGRMTNRRILPSTPFSGINAKTGAVDQVLGKMGMAASQSIICRTDFTTRGTRIQGHLLLVPDKQSLQGILAALGVEPQT